MRYIFEANDGSRFGPVDDQTLRRWADERRILPDSKLIEEPGGRAFRAGELPWLFASQSPPQHAYYQPPPVVSRAAAPRVTPAGDDWGEFWWAIARSALAVVLFFVLHGLGLVFGAYAVYSGVQCLRSGHKFGAVALIVSVAAMAAVCIGWFLRLQGANI